jgi:hypothetical protein
MNDFSEIESELKKLRPAAVSENLVSRIEKRFREESSIHVAAVSAKRSSRTNWISLGLGIGLAAAASFLMLARVHHDEKPAKKEPQVATTKSTPNESHSLPAGARFVPAGFTEVVYHTQDEGLHFPQGATEPVRRMRRHTRETYQWQNPQTGASLRVTYPSEEVVLLPATGQ